MWQFEKLLEKLKKSPQNLSVLELEKILLKKWFKKRAWKWSHFIFKLWDKRLTLPKHNNDCKEVYKEEIRDLIFSKSENEEVE